MLCPMSIEPLRMPHRRMSETFVAEESETCIESAELLNNTNPYLCLWISPNDVHISIIFYFSVLLF